MSPFHDVRLPMVLALGAQGGPQWRTDIITLASGREIRNALWSHARRRWDIGGAIGDMASLQTVLAFFEARKGRLYGFRFQDPLDHSSAPPGQSPSAFDQLLAIADGHQTRFPLIKDYGGTQRRIVRPVLDTVQVARDETVEQTGWQVDVETAEIWFDQAPAAGTRIRCGYEFDCAVRFESDTLTGVVEAFGAGRVVSLSLVELAMSL